MARHVVLHREDIGQVAVEPLGPEVPASGRVDELRGDPDARAGFAHASLEDVAHAKAFADLTDMDVLALEGERRIARDDKELEASTAPR